MEQSFDLQHDPAADAFSSPKSLGMARPPMLMRTSGSVVCSPTEQVQQ